jgi:hypothetical protein
MDQFQLILKEDVEVTITSIHQEITYDGLLEGYPCEKLNNMILHNTEIKAKNLFFQDEIYMIKPVIKVGEEEYGPFGKMMELPLVTCIAMLTCRKIFRDPDKHFSALTVIWFQDQYAFPIHENIIEKITAVPFKEVCGEFHY